MRSDYPLVSIVTPVYNGARFLEACLQSSLAQTHGNWEHVIVDNGSHDDTPGILARYAAQDQRFKLFRNPQTVNALRNHNIAVGRISGGSAYVKILHADDQLLPSCLEKMVALGEANPKVGLVGAEAHCNASIVCRGLPRNQSVFAGRDAGRRTLLRQAYPFWSPSCLLHRTQAVTERDPFYPENAFHADVQSAYEILRKWDFGFVHEPLTVIGSHGESRTSRIAAPMRKMLATNFDLLVTYGPDFLASDELDRYVDGYLRHYYRMLARSALEWRGAGFWRFHAGYLARAGHPLRAGRLLSAIAGELSSSPKASVRRLMRRPRRSHNAQA